ncbi:MAG: hypothetical protein ACOY0T_09560 [Myxococcota bacterium]
MTDDNKKRKIKAALESAKTTVALLEAELDAVEAGADADPFLSVEEARESHGVGREALKAAAERGEIELKRGARGKLLVRRSAILKWIDSRPHKPRPRKADPVSDLDAWERETDAELRRMGGGR